MRAVLRAPAPRRGGEKGIGTRQSHFLTRPDILMFYLFDRESCAQTETHTHTYIIHILIYNKKNSPEKRALSLEEDKGQVLKNPFMSMCARACCQIWPLNKMSLVLPWQQGMKSLSKTFTFSFGMSCQPLPKLLKPVAEDNFSAWTTHIPMHLCQTFAFLPCSSLFSNIIR